VVLTTSIEDQPIKHDQMIKHVRSVLKITSCPGQSLAISAQFTLRGSRKLQKDIKILYFKGSRSFKVIDVNTIQKLVTSACYDKQHVSAYLQLLSR